jgi:hypothetical protein
MTGKTLPTTPQQIYVTDHKRWGGAGKIMSLFDVSFHLCPSLRAFPFASVNPPQKRSESNFKANDNSEANRDGQETPKEAEPLRHVTSDHNGTAKVEYEEQ